MGPQGGDRGSVDELHCAELLDGVGGFGYACGLGRLKEGEGAGVVASLGCEDSAGVGGAGRLVGLGQICFGGVELVATERYSCHVEVGDGVVGVHAYGELEGFTVGIGGGVEGVGDDVDFVEREFLRCGGHDLFDFLDGDEGADDVVNGVV